MNNILVSVVSSVSTSSSNSTDFTDCEDITAAFVLLTAGISKLLKIADFASLRRALLQQIVSVQFPDDLYQSIKTAQDLDTLLDVLIGSQYWGVDLWLPEMLVAGSEIHEAKVLINKYKEVIFPRKLSEVLDKMFMPQQITHKDAYISRIASMIAKESNEVTVGDLAQYRNILRAVIMDIRNGVCVLEHLDNGQGHLNKSESGKGLTYSIMVYVCVLRNYTRIVPLDFYIVKPHAQTLLNHAGAFSFSCCWHNRGEMPRLRHTHSCGQ